MATESDAGTEWDALSDAPPEPPSIEDQESSAGEEWDARSEPPEDRGIPTPSGLTTPHAYVHMPYDICDLR